MIVIVRGEVILEVGLSRVALAAYVAEELLDSVGRSDIPTLRRRGGQYRGTEQTDGLGINLQEA